MTGNSVKNGCKNLNLHSKSFKVTIKPNSYLTSIYGGCPVNPSTHTFCKIDVTQTVVACWCYPKVIAYYENIRNLERVFKLFWNNLITLWVICLLFLSSYSLEYTEGRSKNFLFQCARLVGFGISQNMFTSQCLL